MSAHITSEEMLQSLTGFDELAISQHFGVELGELFKETKATTLLRALVFVQLRRDGKSDHEAKQGVLEMSLGDVNGYFQEAEDEPMPEEPVTPAGEGYSAPE